MPGVRGSRSSLALIELSISTQTVYNLVAVWLSVGPGSQAAIAVAARQSVRFRHYLRMVSTQPEEAGPSGQQACGPAG